MAYEREHGLNGNIMLVHIGADPSRTDKFYAKYLEKAIKELKRKGYVFTPLREAINTDR